MRFIDSVADEFFGTIWNCVYCYTDVASVNEGGLFGFRFF